jgi:curved DNA-binding protein CbpA
MSPTISLPDKRHMSPTVNIDPRNSLYKILMVAEHADVEVISAAYRALARRYHPDLDRTPGAAQRMTQINEAYRVLRDPERRAAYDAELARRRDRRAGDRLVRQPGSMPVGAAGQPIGPPHGSLLEFGRYRGWTLGQIRRQDPQFLEWLMSVPGGRQYREEIATLLHGTSRASAGPMQAAAR